MDYLKYAISDEHEAKIAGMYFDKEQYPDLAEKITIVQQLLYNMKSGSYGLIMPCTIPDMNEFDAIFVLGLAAKAGLVKVRYMALNDKSEFIGEYNRIPRFRWFGGGKIRAFQICYRLIV